jgi:hypothetical protein
LPGRHCVLYCIEYKPRTAAFVFAYSISWSARKAAPSLRVLQIEQPHSCLGDCITCFLPWRLRHSRLGYCITCFGFESLFAHPQRALSLLGDLCRDPTAWSKCRCVLSFFHSCVPRGAVPRSFCCVRCFPCYCCLPRGAG